MGEHIQNKEYQKYGKFKVLFWVILPVVCILHELISKKFFDREIYLIY